jgi:hypothetical protein
MHGTWKMIVSIQHLSNGRCSSLAILGHYEWQVHFAPCDVDMSSVRARFAPDGKLSISVQRRISGQAYGCGHTGGIF